MRSVRDRVLVPLERRWHGWLARGASMSFGAWGVLVLLPLVLLASMGLGLLPFALSRE